MSQALPSRETLSNENCENISDKVFARFNTVLISAERMKAEIISFKKFASNFENQYATVVHWLEKRTRNLKLTVSSHAACKSQCKLSL